KRAGKDACEPPARCGRSKERSKEKGAEHETLRLCHLEIEVGFTWLTVLRPVTGSLSDKSLPSLPNELRAAAIRARPCAGTKAECQAAHSRRATEPQPGVLRCLDVLRSRSLSFALHPLSTSETAAKMRRKFCRDSHLLDF